MHNQIFFAMAQKKKIVFISLFFFLGSIALVFVLVNTCHRYFVKKDYRIDQVLWVNASDSSELLLRYSYFRAGKTSLTYTYLAFLSLDSGQLRAPFFEISDRWSGKTLTCCSIVGDSIYVFDGTEMHIISKKNNKVLADHKEILSSLVKDKPQIGQIFQLNPLGRVLQITNELGATFWVDLPNNVLVSKAEIDSFQATGKLFLGVEHIRPKPAQEVLGALRLENFPQAVLSKKSPEGSVVLTKDKFFLNATFLQVEQNGYQIVYDDLTESIFLLHHNNMDKQKTDVLLSKVSAVEGTVFYELNLSELVAVHGTHQLKRAFILGNRLILHFYGESENILLCLSVQTGELLWRIDLTY